MNNELNALKQVLYGLKIEVNDAKVLKANLPTEKVYFQTALAIPDDALKENRHLIFCDDGQYKEIDTDTLILSDKQSLFDVANDMPFTSTDALRALENKEIAVIVVNKEILLKYTMQYHTRFENIGYYSGNHTSILFMIENLKSVGLTADDLSYIQSLNKKENDA